MVIYPGLTELSKPAYKTRLISCHKMEQRGNPVNKCKDSGLDSAFTNQIHLHFHMVSHSLSEIRCFLFIYFLIYGYPSCDNNGNVMSALS